MKGKIKAFTLIELLISITIFFSLLLLTYVPYSHYQNKAKLKLTSREITQAFYEAKNLAVSGLKDEISNRAIGLYLEKEELKNNYVTFFSYPHDIKKENIFNYETSDIKKIRVKKLQPNININYLGGKDNLLFFYESINGKSSVYTFDKITGVREELDEEEISINFSYKNTDSPSLIKEIIYFTKTNIVDYK